VRLTASDGDDSEPAWSPDGTKIAFRSDRTGNSEIYVMNADGTNPIRLTNQTGSDSDPAWSPDGSTIAFVSDRGGNDGIYVMSADGSGVTRLTGDGVQPAWSPNGTTLAFSRLAWCSPTYCEYDLYVMNADGSGELPLSSQSSDLGAAWSADGRWIAYGATHCLDVDGDYCIFKYTAVDAVQVDSGRVAEVTTDGRQPYSKFVASEPAFRP
jgi:tol-pal system beta propeller repeat protein TolB